MIDYRYMRERYHALKDAGLCPVCGKAPPRPEGAQCKNCYEITKERRIKWQQQRKDNRLCLVCGTPLSDSEKRLTCFRCRLKSAKRYYDAKARKEKCSTKDT